MITEIDKRRLRYIVSPTRFFHASLNQDMEKIYRCWREVWGYAFEKEMDVKEYLYSDYFTRQSHVAAVFIGSEVLGVCTLNVLDLTLPQDLDDTYFKVWPPEVLKQFKEEAKTVLSCCNATIGFNYRKNKLGIPALDLLFAMNIHYLKSTNHFGIVGTARLEKGVEKSCYRLQATQLAHNIPYTIPGQNIDLVCWKRELNMNLWDSEMLEVTQFVWNRSTSIYSHHSKGEEYAA